MDNIQQYPPLCGDLIDYRNYPKFGSCPNQARYLVGDWRPCLDCENLVQREAQKVMMTF